MEECKFTMPLLGDNFPQLQVQTTQGAMKLPEDMKGSWFVLFSHPADFTPVCTTEFVTFPVIAANDSVANALGLLHPGKGTNTVRAVFVVDPNSKVRLILYYPQEAGRNMDEILRIVKALQVADKNGVAMPCNWPNNDLIKDHVIIPPASNVKDAEARLKQYEGFDWWFCHKGL